jgi:arginase
MEDVPQRRYAIVEAPSTLGLQSRGVERLPDALLSNGLAERLNARRADRLNCAEGSAERDPGTQTLNAREIAWWSPRLAGAIEGVLNGGEFPLILGGDCSILLGAALALRRRGRYGLLFVDGHADFYQPEANPNGEAASMELAFATGYGPALLTNIEGRRPLVRPEDTAVLGFRDADEQSRYGSQPLPPEILALDLHSVRRLGIDRAVALAMERVSRAELDGFFIHFDADSLDDRIMPAVDYRLPDGFSWHEMTRILRLATVSARAVGLEVTIYNPDLDKEGTAGLGLTDVLIAGLTTA